MKIEKKRKEMCTGQEFREREKFSSFQLRGKQIFLSCASHSIINHSVLFFIEISFFFFLSFCNSFFFLSPEVFFLLLCCRMVQNLRYVLLMPPRNRRNLMFPYTLSVLIECHCSPTWESTRLHYLLVASVFLPVIMFNVCIIAAVSRIALDTTCTIISIRNGV